MPQITHPDPQEDLARALLRIQELIVAAHCPADRTRMGALVKAVRAMVVAEARIFAEDLFDEVYQNSGLDSSPDYDGMVQLTEHLDEGDLDAPEPCGSYYGTGEEGRNAGAVCVRIQGHPPVSTDGIGHSYLDEHEGK
ncbi:hypothetical protein [Streptomyces sp. NPDC101455]|uniref:hypothetical protein n=1 Tax=Streptomyces sp. NPDC101455 TaxID=3366142 RepID=UPI0037F47D24